VISRRQLLDVGVPHDAIKWWLRTGRLHRIHRGVYALGHPVLSLRGRWIAALLACGPNSGLSHKSAGVARRLIEDDQRIIDITSTGGRGRLEGVRVHRGRPETERVDGLPVTTVERTLIDLAAVLTDRELERAVDQAIRDGHRVTATARRGMRGAASLAAVNRRNLVGHTVTRSELEERFLRTLRKARLPEPEMNVYVDGFLVDAVWRTPRVIVELDGARYHDQPGARRADRRRDTLLTAAGWRVLRAGWHDVEELTALLATMVTCAPSPPQTT
jgi:very-short-patch-repair endonuclease